MFGLSTLLLRVIIVNTVAARTVFLGVLCSSSPWLPLAPPPPWVPAPHPNQPLHASLRPPISLLLCCHPRHLHLHPKPTHLQPPIPQPLSSAGASTPCKNIQRPALPCLKPPHWKLYLVQVSEVHIVGTQPWPIGRYGSCELMIGCIAKATNYYMKPNEKEMEDAQWYDRKELLQVGGWRVGCLCGATAGACARRGRCGAAAGALQAKS